MGPGKSSDNKCSWLLWGVVSRDFNLIRYPQEREGEVSSEAQEVQGAKGREASEREGATQKVTKEEGAGRRGATG